MTFEYLSVFILIIFSVILGTILYGVSYFLTVQKAEPEKISPYECGFNPFDDARQKFDVRFYLVGILFIIFDLEITFLFPWSITLNSIFNYLVMLIFLFILTVGFVYEWKQGALDWE